MYLPCLGLLIEELKAISNKIGQKKKNFKMFIGHKSAF